MIYNSIFILARATFWQLQNSVVILWLILDTLADFVYWCDIVAHAHEGKT